MIIEEPPSYDGLGSLVISRVEQSDLPAYTPGPTAPPAAAQPREFTHEIKNRDGSPRATLLIHGDARLSKDIPTVPEGSDLVGSVMLSLQSPETIQAVCILVSRLVLEEINLKRRA